LPSRSHNRLLQFLNMLRRSHSTPRFNNLIALMESAL
jgi:hypothetical protein